MTLTASAVLGADEDWQSDWTVLTIASDGTWGTATDYPVNRAIDAAIRDCKAKSKSGGDCGARFSTIRAGWSVAFRCGDETIIAAAKQFGEAERAAFDRESKLRVVYRRSMPPCVRVATIDHSGRPVEPFVQAAGRK